MHFLKRLYRKLFVLPGNRQIALIKLSVVLPRLSELRSTLYALNIAKLSPLDRLVFFFNTVSPWYDLGLETVIKAYKEAEFEDSTNNSILKALEILELSFQNAGRDPFGWNRTLPHEPVDDDKVFIDSEEDGLGTKSVTFWKSMKNDVEIVRDSDLMTCYDIISSKADRFTRSNAAPMVKAISELMEKTVLIKIP